MICAQTAPARPKQTGAARPVKAPPPPAVAAPQREGMPTPQHKGSPPSPAVAAPQHKGTPPPPAKTAPGRLRRAAGAAGGAAALLLAVCLLWHPQLAFTALLQGFETAFCRVVPAVFPMMAVCAVVMASPLAAWLGWPLRPYLRMLGIRESAAATALLLGLLGGFAVLAQQVEQLYRRRAIDRTQAELLLCAGLNAGPAFILLSVGWGMLHSLALGWLLLGALYLANLAAALIERLLFCRAQPAFCGRSAQSAQQGFMREGAFIDGLQRAAGACLTLCCFIAFFWWLCALARRLLPAWLAGILTALLEVTNGAMYAAQSPAPVRLWLCAGVLCWAGVSIQMQARALLAPEITLRRFYRSRLFAMPLTLILYGIGLKVCGPLLPAAALRPLRVSRFPAGIWVTFLLTVGAFLYECTPRATLRGKKNVL